MRPISIPNKPESFIYSPEEGRKELAKLLGHYCSYCERFEDERNIELEHIIPQENGRSPHKDKWYNFLLACGGCNKAKNRVEGHINRENLRTYILPHIDDTFHMIEYNPKTKMPKPRENLAECDKKRVQKTLRMLKFDIPLTTMGEETWENLVNLDAFAIARIDDFRTAERKKEKYIIAKKSNDSEECKDIVQDIIKFAKLRNWSVYMYVFEDETEIKDALLQCLQGTDSLYFQKNEKECREYNKYKYYRYYLQIMITDIQYETTINKQEILSLMKKYSAEIKEMETLSEKQRTELYSYIDTLERLLD